MSKHFRLIALTLIFVIICLTIPSSLAKAAENPSVEISVTMTLSGELPNPPETFPIQLNADDMTNPMPEGNLNGTLIINVLGAGTVSFPKITFSKVGVYHYTILQQPGHNPDCIYDPAVYHLTVFVTNAEGGGLETTSVLYQDDDTEKSDAIVFANHYARSALLDFRALKTMDGITPADGRFSFLLLDELKAVLQTKTNLGQNVTFDPIMIKQAGTFVFYLQEKIVTDIRIDFDVSVYKITAVVSRNQAGDYVAVLAYQKGSVPFIGTPIFANKTATGELPYTGQAQSALPLLGFGLILGGVALTFHRKKIR